MHLSLVALSIDPVVTRLVARTFVSFDLDEEQQLLRKTCRDFANSSLKPIAKDLDHDQRLAPVLPVLISYLILGSSIFT